MKAAIWSLKKGKSAGVDNNPVDLVQSGGEDVITALWRAEEWPNPVDPVLGNQTSQERQPAAVLELSNNKPHQPSKQSHAEDHTEQIEAISGEDHC